MNEVVVPDMATPIDFARIACLTGDGRDRSPCQKTPGVDRLPMPKDREDGFIIAALAAPQGR